MFFQKGKAGVNRNRIRATRLPQAVRLRTNMYAETSKIPFLTRSFLHVCISVTP